jgi:large subunit ribosomal protein L33
VGELVIEFTNLPISPLTPFEKAVMRDIISMACTECKRRNYSTTKNKKKTTERLEMSKFCRFCRKHTSHKESK